MNDSWPTYLGIAQRPRGSCRKARIVFGSLDDFVVAIWQSSFFHRLCSRFDCTLEKKLLPVHHVSSSHYALLVVIHLPSEAILPWFSCCVAV